MGGLSRKSIPESLEALANPKPYAADQNNPFLSRNVKKLLSKYNVINQSTRQRISVQRKIYFPLDGALRKHFNIALHTHL